MISDDLNELRSPDTATIDFMFCTLVYIIVAAVGFSQNVVFCGCDVWLRCKRKSINCFKKELHDSLKLKPATHPITICHI